MNLTVTVQPKLILILLVTFEFIADGMNRVLTGQQVISPIVDNGDGQNLMLADILTSQHLCMAITNSFAAHTIP